MDKESMLREERWKLWRILVKSPLPDEDIMSLYRIYWMMLEQLPEEVFEDRVFITE